MSVGNPTPEATECNSRCPDNRPQGWRRIAILAGATLAFIATLFSIGVMIWSSF